MTRTRTGVVLLVAFCTIAILGLNSGRAAAQGRHSDPSCTLTTETLGGSQVVMLSVAGLQHGAWFQVDWVEPQITQVQYMWSTSAGLLQDDVMNDQGSGTYTASVWSLDKQANPGVFQATCSVTA